MLRVRDYTRLPVGTAFDGFEIRACTECRKPGLFEVTDGKEWFTHSETVGFDDRGNPVVEWQMCPALFPKNNP